MGTGQMWGEKIIRNSIRGILFWWFRNLPKWVMVRRGGCVVQCGCWRMETVEGWRRVVGENGRVIVVEADGWNCEILRTEAGRRGWWNVDIVQRALWRERAELTLELGYSAIQNKIMESGTEVKGRWYRGRKLVGGDRLDSVLKGLEYGGVIDLVFMTVSGSELEALVGCGDLFSRKGISFFVRTTAVDRESGLGIQGEVLDFFRRWGLSGVRCRGEGNGTGNVYAWR